MSNKLAVSIIIPTWNTAQVTLKAVRTIQKHLPASFFEIIIVDNHSTDSTKSIFSSDKSVRYYRLSKNFGFSHACNIGALHARHQYLFFLNSDMELVDNHLIDMLSFYLSRSDIGLIGPKFLNPDLTPQGSVFPPQTPFSAFKQFWLNIPDSYTKYTPLTGQPLSVHSVSGGAVLISKLLFNHIGGWNEKYHLYFEDLDLCRRIRHQNLKIFFYPQFTVIHRHGASGSALAPVTDQWRRLIPSSKLYFGLFSHYLINFIIWSGQKFHRLLSP